MNHYESPSFRPFIGVAAVAMTALTVVVTVLVPVSFSPLGTESTTLAKRDAGATEASINPARIDVIGIRLSARMEVRALVESVDARDELVVDGRRRSR
jgi:hypothetical protein